MSEVLLFIVNLGHEEGKIIKGNTFAYYIPAQFDNFSDVEETNQESVIANISAPTLETKVEILPATPSNSKMIFSDDHTPVRTVLLQDVKNIRNLREIKWPDTCF